MQTGNEMNNSSCRSSQGGAILRKVLSSVKFWYHDKISNLYLELSEKSKDEVKQTKFYQKAYDHNEKYLKNKIKASKD